MKPTFDEKALRALSRQLVKADRQIDKPLLVRAFKGSLKPLEDIAKVEAPVGKRSTINPHRVRIGRNGVVKRDKGFDKGGATRRDIRTKIVDGQYDEYVRGLVGVDKRSGHVGWKTHFITRGTKARKTKKGFNRGSTRPNDFLDRAERQGVPLVIGRLTPTAQKIVQDIVNKIR